MIELIFWKIKTNRKKIYDKNPIPLVGYLKRNHHLPVLVRLPDSHGVSYRAGNTIASAVL